MNTLTVCAANMIQIELEIPEIWSFKFKSRGGARLFKLVHLFGKIWYILTREMKIEMRTCSGRYRYNKAETSKILIVT